MVVGGAAPGLEWDQGPVEVGKLGEQEQELLAGAVESSLVAEMPTGEASPGVAASTAMCCPLIGETSRW